MAGAGSLPSANRWKDRGTAVRPGCRAGTSGLRKRFAALHPKVGSLRAVGRGTTGLHHEASALALPAPPSHGRIHRTLPSRPGMAARHARFDLEPVDGAVPIIGTRPLLGQDTSLGTKRDRSRRLAQESPPGSAPRGNQVVTSLTRALVAGSQTDGRASGSRIG